MTMPMEANFLQFLMGMAGQTMVHLGKVPNPVTKETKVDLAGAKYSIDLLGLIQDKTKGNLDAAETKFLENVLAELRFLYVEAGKGGE